MVTVAVTSGVGGTAPVLELRKEAKKKQYYYSIIYSLEKKYHNNHNL